jgi:hypothetical protein
VKPEPQRKEYVIEPWPAAAVWPPESRSRWYKCGSQWARHNSSRLRASWSCRQIQCDGGDEETLSAWGEELEERSGSKVGREG